MDESVEIRPVTQEDLPEIAKIHMRAFPESFLTLLGRDIVEKNYEWLLTGPHETTALIALRKGSAAGFCFGGTFRGALSGFVKKNKGLLFLKTLTTPVIFFNPGIWNKLTQGFKIIAEKNRADGTPVLKPRSFGILSVAADPDYQNLGVGKALMLESEKSAARLGFEEMDLTVHPKNKNAVSFYKKLGWTCCGENPWKGKMKKSIR